MNLSVLEVTWDKGVAKSQWWSYWNLTRNHLLAPSHPGQAVRVIGRGLGSTAGPRTGRGGVGKQEANSEQLEGIPEKQTMEMFQPPSQDFTKPLKVGVGAASSQQGWSVSHRAGTSPATWEHAPSSTACLLLFRASSVAISASRPCAWQGNIRLSSCKPLLLVFHILGVLLGKCLLISLHRKQSSLTASRIIYCH